MPETLIAVSENTYEELKKRLQEMNLVDLGEMGELRLNQIALVIDPFKSKKETARPSEINREKLFNSPDAWEG